MKLIFSAFLSLVFVFGISEAFAENLLENETLFGQSSTVKLDLQFGEDNMREGLIRTWITNTVDDVTLTIYGDSIPVTDPKTNVSNSGNHFRVSSIPDGVMMYGHYNESLDNYKINIYIAGVKYTVTTAAQLDDDKTVEKTPEKIKERYIPELTMTTEFDFKTYWNENFNISVMTYDKNNNDRPDLNPFQGTVDDVKVNVIITLDNEEIATLEGTTEYGEWKGSHYFVENLSKAGEYSVDVIASYLGKSVSESSTMFVVGSIADSGGSNKVIDTDNDGIPDDVDACPSDPEDFDGDMDADGCPDP